MEEINNSTISEILFDLNAIIDFIFNNKQKSKSTEIHEVWSKSEMETTDLQMVQKTLSEIKSDELSPVSNIRYDLLKLLINEVNSISVLNTPDDEDINSDDLDENSVYVGEPFIETFGQMLALNTLQKEGIIINSKSIKNDREG